MKLTIYLFTLQFFLFSCQPNRETEFDKTAYLMEIADLNFKRIREMEKLAFELGLPYSGIKQMESFLVEYHRKLVEYIDQEEVPEKFINSHIRKLEKASWDADAGLIISLFKKNLDNRKIENVLLNEIELLDFYAELFNSKFRAIDLVQAMVVGDRTLNINQRDTIKFMIRGRSRTLMNPVFLGDPDELMKSTENAEELNNYSHDFGSHYLVVDGKEKGKYTLTGVIGMMDKRGELKLPFTYTYEVK